MNALEAQLLDRAMGRFGDTLQNNRLLSERRRENDLDRAMREREGEEARTVRREALDLQRESNAATAEHRKVMEQIQRESKDMQDRHYRLMDSTGVLKAIQDGLKDGTIKPEALRGAISNNPLFKELGLGVDIFQAPSSEVGVPQVWEDKQSGRRFGFRPGSKEMHDLTPNMGEVTEEADPLTGERTRRYRRKLTPADLDSAMQQQRAPVDEAAGPTDAEAADMEEILSRPAVNASQPAGRIKQQIAELQKVPPTIEGAGAAGALEKFESVSQARENGKRPGDIIMLWDWQQKRYRKFQLD